MLPTESSPSSSPSNQEPPIKSDSNPDSDKGSNKFAIISVFFLVLMLFPYLSDPSINISIIPFIITKKDSSQLSPKNITPLFIKYLIFIYYIFILIVIIALDSTVTLDEPETMDVLICAGILAKLKGK
jgi:hypothetical protein